MEERSFQRMYIKLTVLTIRAEPLIIQYNIFITAPSRKFISVQSLSNREPVLESQIVFFIMVNVSGFRRSPKLSRYSITC